MVPDLGMQGDTSLGRVVFADVVGRAFGAAADRAPGGLPMPDALQARGVDADAVPRLFALGYYDRADALPEADRRAFHATLAPVIRWAEEQATHSLWPEVEARAQHAELEWLREVAAVDLARQGDPWEAATMRAPWLLSALEPAGPTPSLDELPPASLVDRLRRVMLTPEHRFAVVRRLAAEARDARLLRALCALPSFFEDDDLCLHLLLTGDSGQISCALHALRLQPRQEVRVADRLVQALRALPLSGVARRAVEVHAQASLHPGAREVLAGALLDLCVQAADAGRIPDDGAVLLDGVAPDARFFRHAFLPADLADAVEGRRPALARALRTRLFEGFAATFTPAGVAHPLNDQPFALRMGALLAARVEQDPASVADVLAVGEGLSPLAAHVSVGSSAALAARFHATYARAVLAGARHAWSRRPGSDTAIRLYGAVARLAAGPARRLMGQGFFGALDARVAGEGRPPVTREMLHDVGRMEAGGTLRPAVLRQTGANMRAVGAALGTAPAERAPLLPPERVAPGPIPDFSLLGLSDPQPPDDLRVPAEAASRTASPGLVALRLYAGVDVISRLIGMPLRLLGYRRDGELEVGGHGVRFSESVRLGGLTLRHAEETVPRAEVARVSAAPSPSAIYRVFGVGLLLTCASSGMVLFFDGLRQSRFDLSTAGVSLGVLGMLLDGACHRAFAACRDRSVVTIERSGGRPALTCHLDQVHAARVLSFFRQ